MGLCALLLIALIEIVQSTTIDTPINVQEHNLTTDENITTESLIEEKLKELRIEMVKIQILSKLEAPPSVQKPSEIPNEIIRLLKKEEEEWQQKRNRLLGSEERLVIHAKKANMRCLYSNASYCKMLYFELSEPLNASSVDLWIYKLTEYPKWVSISLSSSTSNDRKNFETLYYEVHHAGWNKLRLPKMFTPPVWNESTYTIEIIGQTIEYIGELRPFLLISKLAFIPSRHRRDVSCDTNETCCWKPFRISFAEIGFNWVLAPEGFNANFCSGICIADHLNVTTPYYIAMRKILEINSALKDSLGDCFKLCCKPKVLQPVRILYNDEDGKTHDQFITDLSVLSCGCSY